MLPLTYADYRRNNSYDLSLRFLTISMISFVFIFELIPFTSKGDFGSSSKIGTILNLDPSLRAIITSSFEKCLK